MRNRRRHAAAATVAVTALSLAIWASPLVAQVRGTYLYTLSNFEGRLPYDWARINVDQERGETYLIYQNLVRVFNPSGMEIFSFGDDLDLGQILDVAVDQNGDLILLSYKDGRSVVTRCNFRGVPVSPIEIKNVPAPLAFGANRMTYRNGLLYFVSTGAASVIITDANGEFRQHIDFASLMDLEEKQKSEASMTGFCVDEEGNVYFTISVLFKAFKYSRDGKLVSFGRPGSAPGRFGILAGIASDSQGNLVVVDKLKCVVMVFDKDFNFLTEFGYRGSKPENLIAPDDIAIDRKDRIYVTQARRRGVSVFALTRE